MFQKIQKFIKFIAACPKTQKSRFGFLNPLGVKLGVNYASKGKTR
jgi:hypothetical protein